MNALRSRNLSGGFESLESRQLLSGLGWEFTGGGWGAALAASPTTNLTPTTSTVQASTTTALAASNTAPLYGQNVTLTATVTTGSGKVTGLVQFSEALSGSSYLVIGTASVHNGVATLQIGNLAVGSYNLVARIHGQRQLPGKSGIVAGHGRNHRPGADHYLALLRAEPG